MLSRTPEAERVRVKKPSASIRSRPTQHRPPPSHTDRRSGGAARQGDGMSGRSQVQQSADSGGHLGEPSLLQDVQGETQVTLMATHKTQKKENNGNVNEGGNTMEDQG